MAKRKKTVPDPAPGDGRRVAVGVQKMLTAVVVLRLPPGADLTPLSGDAADLPQAAMPAATDAANRLPPERWTEGEITLGGAMTATPGLAEDLGEVEVP